MADAPPLFLLQGGGAQGGCIPANELNKIQPK